ncbi:hypothetical protein JW992_09400 [candidate division KSB1 bacterium]|nr:hypothetical protein [candidate division KSB1 bacterium]
MDKHLSLVAALHVGFGILGLIGAFFFFLLMAGIGFLADDQQAHLILTFIGTFIATIVALTSIPGLIGGIGLWRRKAWARVLILIVSAINLLNFPIGTALGIYSIWVLVHEETSALFHTEP